MMTAAADSTPPEHTSPSFAWLIVSLLGVLVLWVGSGLALFNVMDRGTFGDMFGAVNALFTGLAFAVLIYTMFLQRSELALQREELRETRKEFQTQNDTLKRQRFENTFFQLIRVHQDIVGGMHLRHLRMPHHAEREPSVSREAFQEMYSQLQQALRRKLQKTLEADAVETYKSLYAQHEHRLGHYFRHLYHIIKFVKSSDIDDKRTYTNFVRAQLSSAELALLLCNGLTDAGAKFKPLIEEFALLKNLAPDDVLDEAREGYQPSAFGDKPSTPIET
jgi:hypothetical protein